MWTYPNPRHSIKATQLATCVDVEAVVNRLRRCVIFVRPLWFELLNFRTRGTLVNRSVIEAVVWRLINFSSRGSDSLLIYLSRYLEQETAKGSFRPLGKAATCYYQSNYSKVEAIPLSALPEGQNKRTCEPIITVSLFIAERQAGKLWIPT